MATCRCQRERLAVTLGSIGVGVRDHDDWELGYWLGEPYWNRGYGSEPAKAFMP